MTRALALGVLFGLAGCSLIEESPGTYEYVAYGPGGAVVNRGTLVLEIAFNDAVDPDLPPDRQLEASVRGTWRLAEAVMGERSGDLRGSIRRDGTVQLTLVDNAFDAGYGLDGRFDGDAFAELVGTWLTGFAVQPDGTFSARLVGRPPLVYPGG